MPEYWLRRDDYRAKSPMEAPDSVLSPSGNACVSPVQGDSGNLEWSHTTVSEKSRGSRDTGLSLQKAAIQLRQHPRSATFTAPPYRYTPLTRSLVVWATEIIIAWKHNSDTNDHAHNNVKVPKTKVNGILIIACHNRFAMEGRPAGKWEGRLLGSSMGSNLWEAAVSCTAYHRSRAQATVTSIVKAAMLTKKKKKYRWFLSPMQFPTHGQWLLSCSRENFKK